MNEDKSKIKIVQIVRSPLGGIRKHILTILEGLDSSEFELFLITDETSSDNSYKTFKIENNNEINSRIINMSILETPNLKDFKNIFKAYKLLRSIQVDIIHGHGAKGGLYARALGFLLNCKVIYTTHGGSLHAMHGRFKNLVYRIIEKALYYFTDLFVFESEYSKHVFNEKVNSSTCKVRLNCNAIKYNRINEKSDSDFKGRTIILGAFGLLRWIKGHDVLIAALSILRVKKIDVSVKIFGNGLELANLIRLSKSLGVENHVEFMGYIDNVKEEMSNIDIIVHPSRFESFGYVPLEAMALGKPVVTSLVGGLNEVMDKGNIGFCVNELNPINIAEAIEECINNKELRTQKIQKAYKILDEKYCEDIFIQNYSNIYKGLAKS